MLDGDMQHLPQESARLFVDAARDTGADVVIGQRQFDPAAMPASRYHTNRIGSRALSSFVGVPVDDTQCGFRLFRADILRYASLRAAVRHRNRNADQTAQLRRSSRAFPCRPGITAGGASCGPYPRHHAHLFLLSIPPTPIVSRKQPRCRACRRRDGVVPRRWTLHGLNNGLIFSATYHGTCAAASGVAQALGKVGTWIALEADAHTPRGDRRQSPRDLFLTRAKRPCSVGVVHAFRAYAFDSIDFLRALAAPDAEELFDHIDPEPRTLRAARRPRHHRRHRPLRQLGDGQLPDAAHGRRAAHDQRDGRGERRRESHSQLHSRASRGGNLEVRQSLDTALQIRRRLGDTRWSRSFMDMRDRVAVTLLGRHAWFLRTPALLSYMTGAPIPPCFINRAQPGRFCRSVGRTNLRLRERPRDEAIQSVAQAFLRRSTRRTAAKPSRSLGITTSISTDAQRDSYEGLDYARARMDPVSHVIFGRTLVALDRGGLPRRRRDRGWSSWRAFAGQAIRN